MRTCINFNPHSHEGSDLVTDSPPFSCSISIHTPTKGATHFFLQLRQSFSYFNPHSHEGSDASFTIAFSFCVNFNPHSHEGSDGYCSNTAVISSSISIHTPTKGATDLMQSGTLLTIFQSTLPRRERLLLRNNVHSDCIFQSTLPRRERPGSTLYEHIGHMISIHTPTKGATAILTNNFLIFCSISLINFILYLQIIQILFIFRYKFIFYFIF